MPLIHLSKEYFQRKPNGIHLLNLVNYLEEIDANESVTYNHKTLLKILRKGMKKFLRSHPLTREVNVFKQTLVAYTINGLRSTPLYELNMGILAMCTVERLLYPHESSEFYTTVYGCSKNSAKIHYRKLFDLPENASVDDVTAKLARAFFKTETFTWDRADVEILRTYVSSLQLGEDEMRSIRSLSIHAIQGDAVDDIPVPPANIMPPDSEDMTASTSQANEPDVDDNSTEDCQNKCNANADPPIIPPAPLYSENHGFTRKYFPGQVILAYSPESMFWPARIKEVYDDRIKVSFYPVLDNHVLITNVNDIKPWDKYEILFLKRSLKENLTLKFFVNAVSAASNDTFDANLF